TTSGGRRRSCCGTGRGGGPRRSHEMSAEACPPMLSTHVKVFLACSVLVAALVILPDLQVRLPGNDQHYEPEQPIAFSHRLHAGELEISCLYCHSGAEQSRTAGIPAASLCMSCHQHVTAAFDVVEQERRLAQAEGREPSRIVSAELAKLYRALGLNDELERDPQAELG